MYPKLVTNFGNYSVGVCNEGRFLIRY